MCCVKCCRKLLHSVGNAMGGSQEVVNLTSSSMQQRSSEATALCSGHPFLALGSIDSGDPTRAAVSSVDKNRTRRMYRGYISYFPHTAWYFAPSDAPSGVVLYFPITRLKASQSGQRYLWCNRKVHGKEPTKADRALSCSAALHISVYGIFS